MPPLTPTTIEPLMQTATMLALGLDPTLSASASAVRVGWQQRGQPAMTITDDVVFIRCVEEDDDYNRVRDQETSNFGSPPVTQVQLTETFTRVWRTYWTVYGPNSFDNARKIRSALYSQAIHDFLLNGISTTTPPVAGAPLYTVMDVTAPRRVPELEDGQWWARVDFDCQFNEFVTETQLVGAVATSEVIVETKNGIVADFTVTGG